jgi:hypothetical protein
MSSSSSTGLTKTYSLDMLSLEADSLVDQAKHYRALMDKLPKDDPNRQVYEQVIVDLLERAKRLSVAVTTSANSSF